MDFGYYTDDSAQLAVSLVNTRKVATGEDQLASPEGVRAFADQYGLEELSGQDEAVLLAVRARLRAVFEAEDPATTMRLLNDLLAEYGSTPRLVDDPDDQGIHLHFEPAGLDPGEWAAATSAVGLALLIAQAGPGRLGICRSASCRRAFLDRSKNQGKQFCSAGCAHRENVAAYRQRQRTAQLQS